MALADRITNDDLTLMQSQLIKRGDDETIVESIATRFADRLK